MKKHSYRREIKKAKVRIKLGIYRPHADSICLSLRFENKDDTVLVKSLKKN